jgi:septal ring factor EnvC (AmiA/AmiB activator)
MSDVTRILEKLAEIALNLNNTLFRFTETDPALKICLFLNRHSVAAPSLLEEIEKIRKENSEVKAEFVENQEKLKKLLQELKRLNTIP